MKVCLSSPKGRELISLLFFSSLLSLSRTSLFAASNLSRFLLVVDFWFPTLALLYDALLLSTSLFPNKSLSSISSLCALSRSGEVILSVQAVSIRLEMVVLSSLDVSVRLGKKFRFLIRELSLHFLQLGL